MGTLRFLLALAVLLSHANARIASLNPGVIAVIGFYLISGYVMAGLIRRHYGRPGQVGRFYLDRLLRIYPQYLVIAGITLAWQVASGRSPPFLAQMPALAELGCNLLIVPLNYFMVNGAGTYTLIPPAWSLGAELQFYLLAPVMLLWPRIGLALAALSLGVQTLAWLGRLHTDWFGYRLLPGVLWVFGAGMALFHAHHLRQAFSAPGRWTTVLVWSAPVLALAVYALLRRHGLHMAPYHQETLLGWGLGLPLLHLMARLPRRAWDDRLGDLSYGIFLNHFLLIWLLFEKPPERPGQWLGLALASIALSWATQYGVERPVLAWRRRLRVR